MRLVVKFGGTSLASSKHIKGVAKFVQNLSKKNQVVIVCSAINDTTDELLEISQSIKKENRKQVDSVLSNLAKQHKQIAKETISNSLIRKKLFEKLDSILEELNGLIHGMVLLGEVTPQSLDYLISFGERLSIEIISFAILDLKTKSIALTGKEAGIVTDSNFGQSKPLMDTTRLRVSTNLEPLLSKKFIPVIGGFAGADQHGHVTTFGRGGSDYTATIIASCVKADEVWLMSDVDGLMSADPKMVTNARVIPEVSYVEAMEMALFGAKQIHPRSFEPLLSKKIPMRIRNTFNVNNPGTLVTANPDEKTNKTVKCVSVIRHNGLIDMRGGSMVGAPGTAATIFTTLARAGINIMMISQSPSESSISIVVKKHDLDKAVNILEMDLLGKIIKKIDVTTDVSIIALIGSGMRGTVGVASRVFGSVAKKKTNVMMIAQGSSELNLAFVVKDSDCGAAVQALHDEFKLSGEN
ncbi:MAG TPA: aspartate kinase [Candidatus Nitrosotenuis sp.]|jgi:aspartate kinase|nr:aspartate kinase [Candidatus Nitrosotenuis sp.]HIH45576.1 aspartate kinase [Candidatus Nitrosotenuis sp.]HIH68322.1 aspartate kinase [Candidatus Nitrosotenuis sp.]HII03921.1 aspartate kinase [Candidatus Nitrosotenuis sp.]